VVRREQARWRLSAVLLSLVLALGAVTFRIAAALPGAGDAHRSPPAVVAADAPGAPPTAIDRDAQTRLVASRGHGAVLLFVVALSTLLAALRRPRMWSLTASLPWLVPAAPGAAASRGRAPPQPA
jgi:hypothetical protein